MGASGSQAALWKRHRFLMYKISPPSRSYGRKAPVTPKEEIHLIMTHLFLAPMQQLVENHIFIDFHRNLEDILKNFVNLSRWNVNKNLLKQAPTCKELVKSEAITKAIFFFFFTPSDSWGHRAKKFPISGKTGKYEESQPRTDYMKQKLLKPGTDRKISMIISGNGWMPRVDKFECYILLGTQR